MASSRAYRLQRLDTPGAEALADAAEAALSPVAPGEQERVAALVTCLRGDPDTAGLYEILRDDGAHPKVPKVDDIGKLQSRAEQLVAAGERHAADKVLRAAAYCSLYLYGPDHPRTVSAVASFVENSRRQGRLEPGIYLWLLPRWVSQYGHAHSETRRLVQEAAWHVSTSPDPRLHPEYTALVTELAQQLPDGLGWGSTVVAPVPDEDAYARHAVLQEQAQNMLWQSDTDSATVKLGVKMLERCLAFYQSLEHHWLGTVRKVDCLFFISRATEQLEGAEAALPSAAQVKRIAQRELGAKHEHSIHVLVHYGCVLKGCKRHQQALSAFQRALQLTREIEAPYEETVTIQVKIADILCVVNRHTEAEAMLSHAFETALKAGGPRGIMVQWALTKYWYHMHVHMGKHSEAAALRRRAEKLGCDVSRCT